MDCDRWCLFQMLFVSAIWGTTNPLMRIGAKFGSSADEESGFLQKSLSTVANWRFFIPFLVNQLGSVSFTFLVARLPVSIVVPTVNSLQFVFAAIAGLFLGESLSKRGFLGCLLILTGVLLMLFADHQNEVTTQ